MSDLKVRPPKAQPGLKSLCDDSAPEQFSELHLYVHPNSRVRLRFSSRWAIS
jgi:hypothetical protein